MVHYLQALGKKEQACVTFELWQISQLMPKLLTRLRIPCSPLLAQSEMRCQNREYWLVSLGGSNGLRQIAHGRITRRTRVHAARPPH